MIEIASSGLSARIDPLGAELQALTDAEGRNWLHDGNPAWWNGRAPVLFPIVGGLNRDTLHVDGAAYAMPKHGFARRSVFDVARVADDTASFVLADSPATRAHYPFAFRLTMLFRLLDATLHMTATVENRGDVALPFGVGFHPAFVWPLPDARLREDHHVVFEHAEPSPLLRIAPDGLIDPALRASPVEGATLALCDALFNDDALVWPILDSHSLSYGVPCGPALDIAFPDTSMLGIWTKPGAPFLCIEPWAGHADPQGYCGEFAHKPGIETLMPGDARSYRMRVTLRT